MPRHLILVLLIVTTLGFDSVRPADAETIPADLASDPAVVAVVPVGKDPRGVAVNEKTGRVYVANMTGRTVSVIDADSYQVAAEIPIEPAAAWNFGPEAVAVAEATNTLFVVDTAGDVWFVDASTNQVQRAVKPFDSSFFPLAPGLIFDSETGLIYVTNRSSSEKLAVIDSSTEDVIATFPSFPNPEAIALDHTKDRLYVVGTLPPDEAAIKVIDTRSRIILDSERMDIALLAHDVTVDPDSGTIYATAGPGLNPLAPRVGLLYSIRDGTVSSVEVNICYLCSDVEVNHTTHAVYYAASSEFDHPPSEILTFDGNTNALLSRRISPVDVSGMAVNETSGEVYVLDRVGERLVIFDADKLETTSTAALELPNSARPLPSLGTAPAAAGIPIGGGLPPTDDAWRSIWPIVAGLTLMGAAGVLLRRALSLRS